MAISNIPTVNRGPRRPWDDLPLVASPSHSLPPPGTVWGLVPEPGSGMMLESDERSASRVRGLLRTLILAPPRDSSTTDQALEGIGNPPWFPPGRALGGIRHLARCIISRQGGSMGIRAWSRSPSASVPCRSTNPRREQEPGRQRALAPTPHRPLDTELLCPGGSVPRQGGFPPPM